MSIIVLKNLIRRHQARFLFKSKDSFSIWFVFKKLLFLQIKIPAISKEFKNMIMLWITL